MIRAGLKAKEIPVKKGDLVMVITGKERGKQGKIVEVLPKKQRVRVEKLNMVKRHAKPSQQHRQGGIIEKEASIHWSNVQLICPKCNKARRSRIKVDKSGNKSNVCVKCEEQFNTAG